MTSVTTTGVQESIKALAALTAEDIEWGEQQIVEVANKIRDSARRYARVNAGGDQHPGRLRDGVKVSRVGHIKAGSYVDVGVKTEEIPEGLYEEFGRKNELAHPWLRPAVAENL